MKNVSKANVQRSMKMQLQRFAPQNITPTTVGGTIAATTANNNMPVRSYRQQFERILTAVFAKRAYFAPLFGQIQTLDDISNNHTAFTLKVNNQPVVMKRYDKDPAVAFGAGTGNSSRFGERTEIIYEEKSVPYTWDYGWHEGIDRATVNIDEASAIADRSRAQAEFKMTQFNQRHATFISETATALTSTVANVTDVQQSEIVDAFNEAFKLFTNMETFGVKRAYVVADVWNTIVNSNLAVNDAKDAGVNVANNTVYKFKDFILELIPDTVKSAENINDLAYFTIDSSAYAFTGIETARTIESEDFDGKAFQGRARAGEFVIEDNKAAFRKLVGTAPTPPGEGG